MEEVGRGRGRRKREKEEGGGRGMRGRRKRRRVEGGGRGRRREEKRGGESSPFRIHTRLVLPFYTTVDNFLTHKKMNCY